MNNKYNLTKEQMSDAFKYQYENRQHYDIWLLDYLDDLDDSSEMLYSDFIYQYYIIYTRLDKIDEILDGI